MGVGVTEYSRVLLYSALEPVWILLFRENLLQICVNIGEIWSKWAFFRYFKGNSIYFDSFLVKLLIYQLLFRVSLHNLQHCLGTFCEIYSSAEIWPKRAIFRYFKGNSMNLNSCLGNFKIYGLSFRESLRNWHHCLGIFVWSIIISWNLI